MTACSFGSNKWPHWAAPGRPSSGSRWAGRRRASWARPRRRGPGRRLCEELETVARPGRAEAPCPRSPVAWRVSRWPAVLPQYEVGHLERVASAKATLARQAPMVALAGASYGGVGVPACIGSGRRAARELLAAVQSLGLPPPEPHASEAVPPAVAPRAWPRENMAAAGDRPYRTWSAIRTAAAE